MDGMLIILIFVAVVALAAIVSLFVSITRNASLRKEIAEEYKVTEDALRDKITSLISEKSAVESALASKEEYERGMIDLHEKAMAAQKEAHEKALEAQREAHEIAIEVQKKAHEEAMKIQKEQQERSLESMREVFKNLTAENSAAFKVQSAETIAEILKPIEARFKEFDESVRKTQTDSAAQSAALKTHIENVMKQSKAVGDEAKNLANALTGYSKVQGDFGEMLLTDVLKNAGLTEGIHYITQGVIEDEDGREIKSESGKTMIPDVKIYYPDDTIVIVDSKVSLKAYQSFIIAESVEERKRFAKEHVESVRKHVDELKTKDYASYIPEGQRKVNFNIMFIPVEGAFRLMLEEEPRLWQVAKDNNVLIVSQMTLIIVLNMIQMAWKQADQEKNIAEVYKITAELMTELKGWMDDHVSIGTHLEEALKAYEDSTRKLSTGRQNVIQKITKLEKLDLAPKKSQARIKTKTRTSGPQSIIPKELAVVSQDADETV